MLKVNEFEHGIDTPATARRDNLIFDERANEHFVYHDIKELLTTAKGKKDFRNMLDVFFKYQKPRLKVLDAYSKGDNVTILSGTRRIEEDKADNRMRHNIGGYISDFVTSYVISKPVSISCEDENQLKLINEVINWENDTSTLDYELGYDTSRYGRAFEFHYRDKNNIDRIVVIDPKEMFVIRDVTTDKSIIAAVHVPIYNDMVNMTIYTDDSVLSYKPFGINNIRLSELPSKKHSYKDVPVVEWWNNRFRMGDFEAELSLIDAYDSAQSDTANYMTDLNDALLFISGDLKSAELNNPENVALMKEANFLLAESGMTTDGKQTNVDAKFLYKQYDVAGTEAYKDRILNDIHLLSKVPNINNMNFNSTSSGIALLYKMIGLEQSRMFKVSFYTKALRRRYELISNIHKAVNAPKIEADKLTFTFHANIPQDIWSEIKAYVDAGGFISQKTLADNTTFTDYEKESARLQNESATSDFERVLNEQGTSETL